jgi:hypothetical protein
MSSNIAYPNKKQYKICIDVFFLKQYFSHTVDFFFNNVCGDNRDLDVAMGNSHATNNFFSQTVIRGGADRPAAPWNPAGAFFTTPPALR